MPKIATPEIQQELEDAALRLGISAETMSRFKTEVTKLRSDDNLKPDDSHKL